MQWRKCRHSANGGPYLGRDKYGILEMRAAVDHAVSDGADLRWRSDGTGLSLTCGAQQMPDQFLTRGNRKSFVYGDFREFLTVIVAVSPLHSIFPSHRGERVCFGSAAPIS